MDQINLKAIKPVNEWLADEGCVFFKTRTSWEWFKRNNAVELVDSDALILGKGSASDKVTPLISQVVLNIKKRESLESAKRLEQKVAETQ